jgi:LysM repeat protein
MNDDPYLAGSSSARKIGMLVAFLVVAGLLIGAAWYVAKQLHGVKLDKAQKEAAALELARQQVRALASAAQAEATPPPRPVVTPAEPAPTPPPVVVPPPKPEPQKAAKPAPPVPTPAPVTAPVVARPAPAPTPPGTEAAKQLAEARELCKNDRCLQAREICLQLLEKTTDRALRAEVETLLGDIDITLAFSKRPMPEKTDYTVQSGDTLGGLAKKFSTTKEMIRKSNNFAGDVIRVGDRFRLLGAKWAVLVNKNNNDLLVTMNEKFFKRYQVGTGQYSMTPTGTFHVVSRLEHPTWYRAGGAPVPFGDTNNVLGTHWISLDIPHYGIHGTWETNTIGKQSSQGCIRLLNDQVAELYILLPEGTPVTITE